MFDDAAMKRLRVRLASTRPIGIDAPQYRRASVLIPVVRDGAGWAILFTRRAEHLVAHSGQIAFPGGAVEQDESLEDAAIRETEEEVGIHRSAVELIGRLDDVVTNSGYLVAPFVGLVHQPARYVMQESEVVEVFEVPIDALRHPSQPDVRYVTFRDRRYPAYYYVYEQREIWGLTGRMLKAFLDLVWQSV